MLPLATARLRLHPAASSGSDLDPEGRTSVAIEHDGRVVGEVVVTMATSAARACISVALEPAERGKGFASEAVGAVVDALFSQGVRRIEAAADDTNGAGQRVIESLGFTFEGIARRAALVDGEWVDETRFALLAEDRASWRSRPRSAPEVVDFEELVDENARPFAELATHRYQEEFVAPMAASFRHALLPEIVNGARVTPWFRGVVADGIPVGFVMIAEASATLEAPYLWRMLIDRRHQRRGIGQRAIARLAEHLRDQGHTRLDTSWGIGPGSPEPFYRRLGFVPTGAFIDHEVEGRLDLDTFTPT